MGLNVLSLAYRELIKKKLVVMTIIHLGFRIFTLSHTNIIHLQEAVTDAFPTPWTLN
jgi:hypothetical protein